MLLLKATVEAEDEVGVTLVPGSCFDEAGDCEAGGEAGNVIKLQKECDEVTESV